MSAPRRALQVAALLALGLLGGCMVAKKPAPVVERIPDSRRPPIAAPVPDVRPQPPLAAQPADTYIVKRGDTLSAIATAHGLDFRDLARWNNIANPNAIEVGDVIRLRDPQLVAVAPPVPSPAAVPGGQDVVTTPYQSAPGVEGRAMGSESARAPAGKPLESPLDPDVLTGPKAIKLPYSDAAVAKLRAGTGDTARPAVVTPTPPETRPEAASPSNDTDAVAWSWPAKGAIVANFNENGGPKGIQIGGSMGQPVLASAGGRVVYTGSGLRGYGNLVIIKHNNTFLSAYAHNRTVLVKQGDNVAQGQKIAEMGNSDADRVMLHFEIRRLGKPVDPAKFLPPG